MQTLLPARTGFGTESQGLCLYQELLPREKPVFGLHHFPFRVWFKQMSFCCQKQEEYHVETYDFIRKKGH